MAYNTQPKNLRKQKYSILKKTILNCSQNYQSRRKSDRKRTSRHKVTTIRKPLIQIITTFSLHCLSYHHNPATQKNTYGFLVRSTVRQCRRPIVNDRYLWRAGVNAIFWRILCLQSTVSTLSSLEPFRNVICLRQGPNCRLRPWIYFSLSKYCAFLPTFTSLFCPRSEKCSAIIVQTCNLQ